MNRGRCGEALAPILDHRYAEPRQNRSALRFHSDSRLARFRDALAKHVRDPLLDRPKMLDDGRNGPLAFAWRHHVLVARHTVDCSAQLHTFGVEELQEFSNSRMHGRSGSHSERAKRTKNLL